jgi:hypothetical protein
MLKKDMILGFCPTAPDHGFHPTRQCGTTDGSRGKTDLAQTYDMVDDSWREEFALGHLSDRDREKVLGILSKHRAMWDGHLGTFTATSHRIELVPDARPVHCQPYRAGPHARQAETTELEKMLRSGVIEPGTSD